MVTATQMNFECVLNVSYANTKSWAKSISFQRITACLITFYGIGNIPIIFTSSKLLLVDNRGSSYFSTEGHEHV